MATKLITFGVDGVNMFQGARTRMLFQKFCQSNLSGLAKRPHIFFSYTLNPHFVKLEVANVHPQDVICNSQIHMPSKGSNHHMFFSFFLSSHLKGV
jgi:hypothetical protein